jgi:hypothetical protein
MHLRTRVSVMSNKEGLHPVRKQQWRSILYPTICGAPYMHSMSKLGPKRTASSAKEKGPKNCHASRVAVPARHCQSQRMQLVCLHPYDVQHFLCPPTVCVAADCPVMLDSFLC